MRLSKPVEAVFSVAVGGSMVLVLSGSAFAGEIGTATTSQVSNQTNSQQVISNSSSETVSSNSAVNLVVTTDKAEGGQLSTGGTEAVGVAAVDENAVSATTSAENGGKVPVAATALKPGSAAGEADGAITDLVTSEAAGVVAAVKPNDGTSALIASEVLAAGTVLFHSIVLPIQPKITATHVATVEDLAANVPNAVPTQSGPKVPTEPSRSGGLLSRLSAGLAGTVVPPVFSAPTGGVLGLALEVTALLIISFMTLGRVALNFGDLLRRGGFAHAARSDVGDPVPHNFFATPLVLSYVSAAAPQHSSFLVVAETKMSCITVPNAIRKEEMR